MNNDEPSKYKRLELEFRELVLAKVLDWYRFGINDQSTQFSAHKAQARLGGRLADRREAEATEYWQIYQNGQYLAHYHPDSKTLEVFAGHEGSSPNNKTRWMAKFCTNMFDRYVDNIKHRSTMSESQCYLSPDDTQIEENDNPFVRPIATYNTVSIPSLSAYEAAGFQRARSDLSNNTIGRTR